MNSFHDKVNVKMPGHQAGAARGNTIFIRIRRSRLRVDAITSYCRVNPAHFLISKNGRPRRDLKPYALLRRMSS
jgi:hypothetical protein